MHLEKLEERQLMAVGPRLISVQPNDGDLLTNNEIRNIAPRDLTLVFQEGQTIDTATLQQGVRLTRSGFDGVFDNGNDVIVTPGFIGLGDQSNHVVVRFSATLPDDHYRLELFGEDQTGITAIRNTLGDPLMPTVAGTDRDQLLFELDLGAQVVAVVPQPITRNANGTLTQAQNQIVVYFNEDDLDEASAENPEFYQLIFTRDTVSNHDDVFFNPTSVVYNANNNTATLTFSAPLYNLPGATVAGKASTFRLRIGTDDVAPEAPVTVQVNGAPDRKEGFDIDLVFPDDSVPVQFQQAIRDAADRWEQIIVGDLPDVGGIDDIQIMVLGINDPDLRVRPGGFFGTAIPTALRPDSRLPWQGMMEFDVEDLRALTDPRNEGTGNHLVEEMIHQIGHVLGFGSLWGTFGFVEGAGSTNPRYVGPQAVAQYNAVFGQNSQNQSIPIENLLYTVPTTDFGEKFGQHQELNWRESVFINELMSSRLVDLADLDDPTNPLDLSTPQTDDDDDLNGIDDDNPLSVITIGAMADLGYDVDFSQADFYKPVANVTYNVPAPPPPPSGGPKGADIVINQEPGSRFGDQVNLNLDTAKVIQITGNGATINDTATIRVVDNAGTAVTFELNKTGGFTAGRTEIPFLATDSAAQVAVKIRNAINGSAALGVTASLSPTDPTRLVLLGDQEVTLGSGVVGVRLDRFTSSLIVHSSIDPQHFPLPMPGGADEPGHRHIEAEEHIRDDAQDRDDIIPTYKYNFKDLIGFDSLGNPLPNVIDDDPNQEYVPRIREIFEIYSNLFGVEFVETADEGFTIAIGDPRAVDPFFPTGPGGLLAVSNVKPDGVGGGPPGLPEPLGGGIVIMDAAESWDDDFGANFFQTAMNEIGQLLGLGFSTELPGLTLQSGHLEGYVGANIPTADVGDIGPVRAAEPVFPGDHDIVHGQRLFRPQSKDIDLYRFTVEQTGLFTAETFAERLPDSSSLDTYMVLYRESPDGRHELIARNDDYYSEDSYIELKLEPGNYFIAVAASGNDQFDPTIADTGFGGTSEGKYDLRLTMRPEARSALLDDTGTQFDGDADGIPGGAYDFWFQTAAPLNVATATPSTPAVIYVDKANQPAVGQPQPTGELSNPFNTIRDALSYLELQRKNHAAASPGEPVTPYLVRIVGNGGADGNLATLGDNLPYQIGQAPTTGLGLPDGSPILDNDANFRNDRPSTLLNVPQNVTLMIDEGAVFKLRLSSINVGSESPTVDRSGGALQVLGTPRNSVFFTSYDDEQTGVDTNPTVPQSPKAGDWGGLLFRRDQDLRESHFDWERNGVFLNYVNHANIRFGGGKVNIASANQTVSPIEMVESRPTVTFNRITNNQDAAISADPNSFEETNFHSPQSQYARAFTADYQRIGPDIHGNTILNNSKNGLFIRIATVPGAALRQQTVAGRWDDTDIPHLISENLVLQGTPGGAFLEQTLPPTNLITFPASSTPGTLVEGNRYLYRMTFVDRNGFESPPSAVFPAATDNPPVAVVADTDGAANTTGSIQINGIPQATGEFVGRRIYRLSRPLAPGETSAANVDPAVEYLLVGEMDRTDTVFVDTGREIGARDAAGNPIGGILNGHINAFDGIHRPRFDARLAIDPGTIVKLEGARIQANIGTQFLAEGADGLEVVFTSQRDDRFGGSGTFNSNNDAPGNLPAAGNWGGLVFNHSSIASIDHALITYGGGITTLGQSFAGFNVIEIHQAEARITNSVIENNANGKGGQLTNTNRLGQGSNDPATIFVRGAQPIIVSNIIRDNDGPAISINANALNHELRLDGGRETGLADRFTQFQRNAGPLVQENRLANNVASAQGNVGVNGMEVRGGILTTQSLWDDTDIVHVLRDRIYIPDFHTYGGLRLKSQSNESLVVKLLGTEAGFTATGNALDINDRIGGMLHVVGTPGFPVVFTSLHDDTVGAGFTPQGLPNNDTNGNGDMTVPQAGNWRSLEIGRYAHDRNVAIYFELETEDAAAPGTNATAASAESLGSLAPHEKAGDENLRLGFEVHGILNDTSDVDVYSFKATPGTEVWIDVDRTTHSLDTVIELIDANGQILAQSNNSYYEGIQEEAIFERIDPLQGDTLHANVLQKSLFSSRLFRSPGNLYGFTDYGTTNPRDAGFRIVLPGPANPTTLPTFHVRVRSSNVDKADVVDPLTDYDDLRDGSKLDQGLTSGQYQFQVRLREVDEHPGSTIRFADVRYARNGIDLTGQVIHSPLMGEAAEIVTGGAHLDSNDSLGAALNVGNVVRSDRGALAIAGTLVLPNAPSQTNPDVDFYQFEVDFQNLQNIPDFTNPTRHMPLVFDLDYADGLARANTNIAIFNAAGELIFTGRDSNVADDQAEPLNGADIDALDRGSAGSLDPYIGPVELIEGTYYLAVSTSNQLPTVLDQFMQAGATSVLTRLEPIGSIHRIVEDRIDPAQRYPDQPPDVSILLNVGPQAPGSRDVTAKNEQITPFESRVSYHLGDVTLFVNRENGQLQMVDAFTGFMETTVAGVNINTGDIALNPQESELYTFTTEGSTDAADGRFHRIDLETGSPVFVADDGILTYVDPDGTVPTNLAQGVGYEFEAMTYFGTNTLELYAVGSRSFANGDNSSPDSNVAYDKNVLYRFTTGGVAISGPSPDRIVGSRHLGAGTNIVERGRLRTASTITIGGNNADTDPAAPGVYSIQIRTEDGTLLDTVTFTATGAETNRAVANGLIANLLTLQAASPGIVPGADSFEALQATEIRTPGGTRVAALELQFIDRGRLQLQVSGPSIANEGNGFGPGGEITGLTYIQGTGQTYAVSEEGGLWRVNNVSSSLGASMTFITNVFDPADGTRFPFEGLTYGPVNAEDGRYANLVFAMDAGGDLVALDPQHEIPGTLEPVFNNNLSVLRTGLGGVNGLAFSNLDFNLWHVTGSRGIDAGHGVPVPEDLSRTATTLGGRSFHFGYEGGGAHNLNNVPAFTPAVGHNYDFAGGAYGTVESALFDLSSYSAADKPVAYFNYFLDSENTPPNESMRDSFRVFATDDSGNWVLLSTNDQHTGRDLAINPNPTTLPHFRVQETFETANWRQARVDLSPLAGRSNVRLRIDFSSAGSLNVGHSRTQGDELRAIDGSKLRDRMYTVIEEFSFENGVGLQQAFEVDTGYTLVAPTGAKIQDGDNFTVDGIVYEFDNVTAGAGLGGPPGVTPGRIRIPYTIFDTAAQVAYNMQVALEVNYVPFTFTPDPLNDPTSDPLNEALPGEPTNDTLATAHRTNLIMAGDTYQASGFIGDNNHLTLTPEQQRLFPNVLPDQDVDLFKIRVSDRSQIRAFADPATMFAGAMISLLDDRGVVVQTQTADAGIDYEPGNPGDPGATPPVNFNDPNVPPAQLPNDPGYTTEAGYYYVMVWGAGNTGIDPFREGQGSGGDTGAYDLTIEVRNPDEPVLLAGGGLDFDAPDRNDIEVPYTFINTHLVDNRVNIPGARNITASNNLAPDPRGYPFNRFIEGEAGVTDDVAHVRIPLHAGMTDAEVADAIAHTIADVYHGGDRRLVKTFDEIVRLIEHRVVDRQAAPPGETVIQPAAQFGLVGGQGLFDNQFTLEGDNFGAFLSNLRARNNGFEGLYVDDLIVGLAERGEMVFGAQNNANYVEDRYRPVNQVVEGPYQVEIRRGTEFGTSLPHPASGQDPSPLAEGFMRTDRHFDSNDRFTQSVSLTIPAGWEIKEGRTFTLSDGVQTLTFEFDDADLTVQPPDGSNNFVLGPGVQAGHVRIAYRDFEPAHVVAARIRDAINSAQVQDVLKVTAGIADGTVTGTSSASARVNLYGNVIGNIPDNRTAGGAFDPFNFGEIETVLHGVNQTTQTIRSPEGLVIVNNNEVEHGLIGDSNQVREQGLIYVHSNQISFSSQFGVNYDSGARGNESGENNPHPGPVRNLREVHDQRLVPAAVIENNIIFRNNQGAIHFSGDNAGGQAASVPFGRIVNNTLYGTGQGGDVGIEVADNASPTILNNIVANFGTGITVDASSNVAGRETVVGGTLYQDNATDTTGVNTGGNPLGDSAILLQPGEPLFVNAAENNFYLAVGSQAIDSGINSLGDRNAMLQVRNPLGIAPSPIIAPEFDAFGQLRVDDPVVNPPGGGAGQTPFIDRGALDRADLVGINAFLHTPRDNDAEGLDRDPTVTVVQRQDGIFTEFLIQLIDGPSAVDPQDGVGVDDPSVVSAAVTITENGRRMVEGEDYTFAYDKTNNLIRITPVAGIFEPGGVYVITLNNTDKFFINASNGAQVKDGDEFSITDNNGNIADFEYESGYSLMVRQSMELVIPTAGGGAGGIADGDRFTVRQGAQPAVTFEFDSNDTRLNPNNIPIVFATTDSAAEIALKVRDALIAANLGLMPGAAGNRVHVGATATTILNIIAPSQLTQRGVAQPIIDGEVFTIKLAEAGQPGQVVNFEFDNNGVLTDPANIAIPFDASYSTDDLVRGVTVVDPITMVSTHRPGILDVIANAGMAYGMYDLDLTPVYYDNGHVHLGGTVNHILETAGTGGLTQMGVPGVRPEFGIQIPFEGADVNGIADGQTFVLSDGVTAPKTFEFDSDGTLSPASDVIVQFQVGDTADTVANLLAAAIGNAYPVLNPVVVERATVVLQGADANFIFTPGPGPATTLVQVGVPGMPAAVAVPFLPDDSFTDESLAINLLQAINTAVARGLLVGTSAVTRGPEVTLLGASAVSPGTTAMGSVPTTGQFVEAIQDIAGNDLQPNQPAGETRFTILLGGAQLDFGDAPDSSIDPTFQYPTRFVDGGARHVISADNPLFLGSGVDADANGQPSLSALGDDTDHQIDLGTSPLTLQTRAPFSVTVPAAGGAAFADGETFTITLGAESVTFEFNKVGNVSDVDHIAINVANADDAATVADNIVTAVRDQIARLALNPTVFFKTVNAMTLTNVNLGGTSAHTLANDSALTPANVAPATLTTPGAGSALQLPQVLTLIVPTAGGATGGIEDGERFTLTDSTGPVVFEFDSNGAVQGTNRTVAFTAASTKEEIADAIVQAIVVYQAANPTRLQGVAPQHLGGGRVHIGGPSTVTANTANTTVTQVGTGSPISDTHRFTVGNGSATRTFEFNSTGGVTGTNIAIPFDATTTLEEYADRIVTAVNGAGLANVQARNLGNGVVEFDLPAAGSLNATAAPSIATSGTPGGVADGQTFTVDNGVSVFTFEFDRNGLVADGNVAVTYTDGATGDAVATAIAAALGSAGLNLSPTAVGATVELAGDDEDGVVFNGPLNPFVDTPITITASRAGVIDAWVDFNQDGDWSDPGEKILDRAPVNAGVNNLVFRASSQAIVGFTYARFRVSTLGGLEPFGLASDGEVEDYRVEIISGSPAIAGNDPAAGSDPADFTTDEDTVLNSSADLLANDTDPDNDPVSLAANQPNGTFRTTSSKGAVVVVNADGTFSYDPRTSTELQTLDVGEQTNDTFAYVVTDGIFVNSPLSVGTVTITITGANDAPTPGNDAGFSTDEDTPFTSTGDIFANDTDPEGDPISLVTNNGQAFITTSALGAAVVVNADGTFSYDPSSAPGAQALDQDEMATDTFTYQVTDGRGEIGTGTVSISLTGINDPVVAVDDINFTTDEDSPLAADPSRNLLDNDNDPEGNATVDAATLTTTLGAEVTINADGTFSYDPTTSNVLQQLAPGATATDTFNYTARDATTSSVGTVRITVNGLADVIANNDQYNTNEDTVLPPAPGRNLLSNDDDLDGVGTLVVAMVNGAAGNVGQAITLGSGATLTVNADGTFTYDPTTSTQLQALRPSDPVFNDTFTYAITDGANASTAATVTIRVTGVNDAPTASPDSISTETGVETRIVVITNDTDPEDGTVDPTTVKIVSHPFNGSVTVDAADGSIRYSSDSSFDGTDTFTYRVADSNGVFSAPATVTVTVNARQFPWRNPTTPLDVNADGLVTILDALLVVNDIRDNLALSGSPIHDLNDPNQLQTARNRPPFVDAVGQGHIVNVSDILAIVQHLRNQIQSGPSPEGEGESSAAAQATGVYDAAPVPGAFPGYHKLTNITTESYFRRLDEQERDAAVAAYAGGALTAEGESDETAVAYSEPDSFSLGVNQDDDTLDVSAIDAMFGEGFEF